jgi:hypothetical protein
MTVARPVGLWRDEHHRYYYGDRGPMPSVTSVTKVIDKSGPLVGWAKRETAASAVRNVDRLLHMIQVDGEDAARAWLSRIPDYQRDTKADLGSGVHRIADILNQGGTVEVPPDQWPHVMGYRRFQEAIRPHILLSEAMIANLTLGYGGTLDLVADIGGHTTLIDIKTGGNVYAETAIQLAGYADAEFTATPDDPTPRSLPTIDRYAVLWVRPYDWELIPYDVNDRARRAFRSALEIYGWLKDYAPWVKGRPITEGSGA